MKFVSKDNMKTVIRNLHNIYALVRTDKDTDRFLRGVDYISQISTTLNIDMSDIIHCTDGKEDKY